MTVDPFEQPVRSKPDPEEAAEERAAEKRGDYMSQRERDRLSDRRADQDERAADRAWP